MYCDVTLLQKPWYSERKGDEETLAEAILFYYEVQTKSFPERTFLAFNKYFSIIIFSMKIPCLLPSPLQGIFITFKFT